MHDVLTTTRRFTVDEYYKMAEAGILSEDDRVELINGEIIEMSPIGIRHRNCVNNLNRILNNLLPETYIVSVQNPIRLGEREEPVPDIAVIQSEARGRDFSPADVLLLIEVADTTREYDERIKVPMYAAAGIREVWLVALQDNAIVAYRNPERGTYAEVHRYESGKTIQPQQLPIVTVEVARVLKT